MLYRLLVDGDDILDYNNPDMILLSPMAEIEIDVSGSFEFTIPPNHIYYDRFTAESIMKMMVEIYEDTTLHWFGRPIELHLDFYKNKKIYCEGALGFFNDSVIREAEYEDTLLSTIFAAVITEHNTMVDTNRQFTVGRFTVPDHLVYRKFNYEQTSDVLKSKFLDAEDGHFFVRRENGINYIDFLKDMPYTCDQPVQFAKNLLNFTYSFDGKDFATCVIPLGGNDQETGKPITIASVNNNSDILIGNAAANYGKIVKVQHYSDLTDPYELLSEGQRYLTMLQYNAFLIECSAVDLHSMTPEVEDVVIEEGETGPEQLFRVGQKVTCISNPHGINLELPLSKMTLYLDSAAKQITLGRIPKKTLARFYKNISSGTGSEEEEENEIPDGFAIVSDPETGDPTLVKVPVTMQIMTLPYRDGSQQNSTYSYGDTLDFTGLTAKLVAKGQTQHGSEEIQYFTDSHYPDSYIPFNELSFDHSIYDQHVGKLMVWCTWTNPYNYYNGVKFKKPFYMQSLSEAAIEAANAIDHIVIEIPPAKLEYFTGNHILLAGAKVVGYTANNQPYTQNGYENGVIPLSALVLNPAIASADESSALYGEINGVSVVAFSCSEEKISEYNPNNISYYSPVAAFTTLYIDGSIGYNYIGGSLESGYNNASYIMATAYIDNSYESVVIQRSGNSGLFGFIVKRADGSTLGSGTGFGSSYTFNGVTYSYCRFTSSTPITTPATGMTLNEVLEAMITGVASGGMSNLHGQQTITVEFPRANSTPLTDTFDIQIKPSEHGR